MSSTSRPTRVGSQPVKEIARETPGRKAAVFPAAQRRRVNAEIEAEVGRLIEESSKPAGQ